MFQVAPLGSSDGFKKPVSRLTLVVLEHVDADRRADPQDERRDDRAEPEQDRDLRPARPGDEERRAEDRGVHDRRPEVGLQEDEQHRHRREPDRRSRRLPIVDPLASLGEERGEEQDEQELAELGRLEAEGADVDPAARVPDARPEDRGQHEHEEEQAVDEPVVLPPEAGVDERDSDHPG